MLKTFTDKKYNLFIIPTLVLAILLSFSVLVVDSIKIVANSNKSNFAYTVKVRDMIEALDIIFERAQVNVNMFSEIVFNSYDLSKKNDVTYNKIFTKKLNNMAISILDNSPGVSGAWFQVDANLPFSDDVYTWIASENGKIIDRKKEYEQNSKKERTLNPEEDSYYYKAITEKDITCSKIYTDPDSKREMLTIAKPVYKNNILIGVVGLDISVANLEKAMQKMQGLFKNSEVYLFDEKDEVVLYTLEPNCNKVDIPFSAKLHKNEKDNLEIVEYSSHGQKRTAIKLWLSNNYHIVVTIPNLLIFAGYDRLFMIIYFTLLILMVLTAISLINRYSLVKLNLKLQNEITTVRNIINYSPTIMCLKDHRGIYIDCNDKFLKFANTEKENIIGKNDYDIFPFEIADMIKSKDKESIITGRHIIQEFVHDLPNGKPIAYEIYRIPLFDSKNRAIGIIMNGLDITKRYEEQEQLEKAKEAAEKTAVMKSSFLANMSHEIRTPMNGVLGFLQLLEDTNPTEEQNEFIKNAQKSSEILLHIINEILDFSKIEAGKLQPDDISFDIRSVVEDVTIMNTSKSYNKGVEINSLICSDVPQKVFGDPRRIKQILNNLVDNAIKFTQQGDIIIYVNQIQNKHNQSTISFSVKDTGIGIPKEKLKAIFDSFTQADVTTTRKYGGTGLGLSICQKLAELMNGRIEVQSKINEGSTFTLTVPFKIDTTEPKQENEAFDSLSGKHILIIGNNITDTNIIRYYLNEANCIIKKAQCIQEALDILEENKNTTSAIIIDSRMQNAEETYLSDLLKVNDISKDIPLILYTPIATRGDGIIAKEKGFAGYLTKPFKKQELIDVLSVVTNPAYTNNELVTRHLIKELKFDARAKILLVEDSELNCKFITKLLNKVGLNCDIACDGQAAIEAIKSKKYDLIFMDCQMPIMDGYKATEAIRTFEGASKHTPIIAMTANAMSSDEQKCYESGMDEYISKPININKLFSTMEKYIKLDISEIDNLHTSNINIDKIARQIEAEVGISLAESKELLLEFARSLPEQLTELEKHLNDNEYKELSSLAHKLKGASANLRLTSLSDIATQLEQTAKQENKDNCVNLVNQLRTQKNLYPKPQN